MNIIKFVHKLIFLFISLLILNSCSPSDKKMNNLKYAIKQLPPETALISCNIIEIIDISEEYMCKVRIDTVFGYGQSTPHLATGSELEIIIPSNLTQELGDKSSIVNFIKSQKSIGIEIKHQKLFALNKEAKSNWTATKLKINRKKS